MVRINVRILNFQPKTEVGTDSSDRLHDIPLVGGVYLYEKRKSHSQEVYRKTSAAPLLCTNCDIYRVDIILFTDDNAGEILSS